VKRREWRFVPALAAVSDARHFVGDEMARWGYDGSVAGLVIDELAANAVQHAHTPFQVTVWVEDVLAVEVTDGSLDPPVMKDAGPESVTGRGLYLVDALANAWGVRPTGVGKTVWALLDAQPIF
jgi:hypothetical protein